MNLGTRLYTFFYGNYVGEDEFGNQYYSSKKIHDDLDAKRWVIFKGKTEATKIPPHWHAWLHKTIDAPPLNYNHKFEWQKDHKPNMTGTKDAYFPSSHPLSKNYQSEKKKLDYESWNP